jgi:hypothetical protein
MVAGEHAAELQPLDLAHHLVGVGGGLDPGLLVARLLGQLVEGAGVLQRGEGPVEVGGGGLELGLLPQECLGLLVRRPEAGILGEAGDLGDAVALPFDVKATPGAPPAVEPGRSGVLRSGMAWRRGAPSRSGGWGAAATLRRA